LSLSRFVWLLSKKQLWMSRIDRLGDKCYLARSFVIRDGLLPEYFRGERCGKAADSEMGKWSWRVREVIVRAAGALLDGAEVNR
jgi:hypothetical protein